MASPNTVRHRVSPPVHQHRTWRHLQRAAVADHPELGQITQARFYALMAPAASIALWILQHAPGLAEIKHLRILVAEATDFESLDSGRWFQFIPWLLGRAAMTVEVALTGDLLPEDVGQAAPAQVEVRLRTHFWAAVKNLVPATLHHQATVQQWSEGEGSWMPDLCALFSVSLSRNFHTLLSEDGVVPFFRNRVPVALFSTSEVGQLLDVYTLRAAGLQPKDPECWPNPWALPTDGAAHSSVYGKMAWAAEFDTVPDEVTPNLGTMRELADALLYTELLTLGDGPDGLLSLGESIRTARREADTSNREVGAALLRLPRGVAVDSANGHVYQLQDSTALLLETAPAVPRGALALFPGHDDVVRRVMWTVRVHREYVAPFVRELDEALKSQFAALEPGRA